MILLFEILFISANSNEQSEKSHAAGYHKPLMQYKELPECPNKRDGYTRIEKESTNYEPGNYYACNMKFRSKVVIQQSLLLLHNCNFTILTGNPGVIYLITPDNPQTAESVEIQNCHFYRTRNEAIHIESKSQLNEINIFNCSFERCESTIDKKINSIYLKVAVGKIEKCKFINNKADGADIYYSNTLADENGRVKFNYNFFIRNAGSINGYGNLIQFEKNSLFDFIGNKISVSKLSGIVRLFNWPSDLNDLTGYKFEGNSMYPVNNDIIANKIDLLKDFFPEDEDIDCPILAPPLEGSSNKPLCQLDFDSSSLSQGMIISQSFVSIVYCTFYMLSNNKNNFKGGAIYISINEKMPIYDDPICIYNSEFTSCSAKFGCAIYIDSYQDSMKFDFRDCYFYMNTYNGDGADDIKKYVKGGAIYINTRFSGFEFTRCSFDQNTAGEGGAIYYISDTTDVIETETNPNDYSLYFNDCRFYFNFVFENGAALFISLTGREHSRPVLIETSIFFQSFASDKDSGEDQPEYGGAIYYSTSYTNHVEQADSYEFRTINCMYNGGSASFGGGGIYLLIQKEEPSRSFEISQSSFIKNQLDQICYDSCPSGADILFEYDTTSSSQTNLNERILDINECYFSNYIGSAKGGSISILIQNEEPSKSIEINGCTIRSSSTHGSQGFTCKSGAIYYHFASQKTTSKLLDETINKVYSFRVVDCSFTKNVVEETGGSIEIDVEKNEPSHPIEISRCTFSEGQAKLKGGYIYLIFNSDSQSSTTFVKDHFLYINDCSFAGVEGKATSGIGGSFYLDIQNGEPSKPIEINNCSFTTCSAEGLAGAIYYNYISKSVKKLLDEENTANTYSLNIVGCTFTSNKASMAGGALAVNIENQDPLHPIEIRGCTFTKNKANDEKADSEYGGAIYYINKATASSISDDYTFGVFYSTFNENDASYFGGAISIRLINEKSSNHIKIDGCSFDKNTASIQDYGCGSSICYEFAQPAQSSNKMLEDSSSVSLNVNNCTFSGGTATNMGDMFIEIHYNIATTIEFNNCSFRDSEPEGFYLYSTNPSSLFHFNDCDFLTSSTIYFMSDVASSKIENCRFNDMKSKTINYISESETPTLSDTYEFRVENCNFTQKNEIESLVYFITNLSTQFYFISNNISIENEKTCALGSKEEIDFSNSENGWHFEKNAITPGGRFIKTKSANDIPASCTQGFICADIPPCDGDTRCDYDLTKIEGYEHPSVYLTKLKFNKLTHDDNGAAIHIYNFHISCNNLEFIECTSEKSGGGIYIYLDKNIDETIKLEKLHFTTCKAICGGGIFVYSKLMENKVDIINCKFVTNIANEQPESDKNGDLYGGSAIYLEIITGKILRCTFNGNIGHGVKLVNNFEAQKKLNIKNDERSLFITDCVFETDKQSKSSILYVSGKNDEIPVEVNGCIFKGKLEEGNFHINAESLEEKKNNEMIKLHIKSCKFPNGIKSAVNSMNSKILLEDSIDEMSQKSYKKVDKNAQFKFDFIVGLTCIAVVSAIAIYFTTKRNQQIDSENSIEL